MTSSSLMFLLLGGLLVVGPVALVDAIRHVRTAHGRRHETNRHDRQLQTPTVYLRLVNADTQTVVTDFDPLVDGAKIDVAMIGTRNLTIEAVITTDGPTNQTGGPFPTLLQGTNDTSTLIDSVQFGWDDQSLVKVESQSPWFLCGNLGPDSFACRSLFQDVGQLHRVTATVLSPQQTVLDSVSVWLALEDSSLPSSSAPQPSTTSTLTLVDADTDTDINVLRDRYFVDIALFPRINIRATPDVTFATQSVAFSVDGAWTRIENWSPYYLAGNLQTDALPWTPSTEGMHVIVATPYSGKNATGRAGPVMEVAVLMRNVPTTLSPSGP